MSSGTNKNDLLAGVNREKVSLKGPYSKLILQLKQFMIKNNLWTDSLLQEIPKRWERHEDLIIFPNTAFKDPAWYENGMEAFDIVLKVLNCTRLARKSVVLSDGYRTPQVKLLKGTDGWVQRVDNGIKFRFEVTQCMFSFGNITEKLRIAQFACRGETVVDLFAGIGYFTLPFLVHAGADHVHACEWNPKAIEALKGNLLLNKIHSSRYTIHEGDNRVAGLNDIADRVNLGLLPSSQSAWHAACRALKRESGGILHIHQNVDSAVGVGPLSKVGSPGDPSTAQGLSNSSEDTGTTSKKSKWNKKCCARPEWQTFAAEACLELKKMLEEMHGFFWTTRTLHIEFVKYYAPHVAHIVVDVECRPQQTTSTQAEISSS